MIKDPRLDGYRESICEFQKKIPVPIEDICKHFDVSVESIDMPDELSGFIMKKNGHYYIYSNSKEPKTRQRFTIAHELSHFILHKDNLGDKYPENVLLRGGLSNKEETEANKLAADILMPYKKIDSYIEKNESFSIPRLAEYFDVSTQTMSIRLGIPMDI